MFFTKVSESHKYQPSIGNYNKQELDATRSVQDTAGKGDIWLFARYIPLEK